MTILRFVGAAAAAVALHAACAQAQDGDDDDAEIEIGGEVLIIRGWLEHARLMPVNLLLDAKLDPGARTSSIDAEILRGPEPMDDADETEEVDEDAEDDADEPDDDDETAEDESAAEDDESERDVDLAPPDRRETIVFRVTNETGRTRTLEREIVRYVEVKLRGGGTVRRPVVWLGFCVAGVWLEGEVNLADREGFNYPLLVGRNMLAAGGVLVDSRETYTRRSRCEPPDDSD